MKKPNLMDPSFKYVPAASTNLHATFARVRREMKQAEAAKKPASNVKPLKKEKGNG